MKKKKKTHFASKYIRFQAHSMISLKFSLERDVCWRQSRSFSWRKRSCGVYSAPHLSKRFIICCEDSKLLQFSVLVYFFFSALRREKRQRMDFIYRVHRDERTKSSKIARISSNVSNLNSLVLIRRFRLRTERDKLLISILGYMILWLIDNLMTRLQRNDEEEMNAAVSSMPLWCKLNIAVKDADIAHSRVKRFSRKKINFKEPHHLMPDVFFFSQIKKKSKRYSLCDDDGEAVWAVSLLQKESSSSLRLRRNNFSHDDRVIRLLAPTTGRIVRSDCPSSRVWSSDDWHEKKKDSPPCVS